VCASGDGVCLSDVLPQAAAEWPVRGSQPGRLLRGLPRHALRLAYGPVKGYEENGKPVPFQTTWTGMYGHSEAHGGKPPYDLPQSYLDVKGKVDPRTPVNFVTTADTTGGNSGSPAVNRKLELVGLLFDGNIQSLGNDVVYTEDVARSVCVHPAAMTAALRQVYGAEALADELEKGPGSGAKAPARKKSSGKK